jgi:hypothetical protein
VAEPEGWTACSITMPAATTVGVIRLMQLTNSYDLRFGSLVFRNGQGGARIEGVRTLAGGLTRVLNTPTTISTARYVAMASCRWMGVLLMDRISWSGLLHRA